MTVTADADTDLDRTRFFIDGQWVDPLGSDTHRALEAATEQPLGTASLGTDADIDRAGKAAPPPPGPWPRGPDHRGRARGLHAQVRGRADRAGRGHEQAGQPGERHADRAVVGLQRRGPGRTTADVSP